mmetsp:Transcript_1439/g.3486  ORF Transcript_1439/g.3486 Transcript_1439/m.3486 type:complete len:135 (-) Transcript_1439:605-1009(-)
MSRAEISQRYHVEPGLREWSTSLFGCHKQCGITCYGTFCFPCLYADLAEGKTNRWKAYDWWEAMMTVLVCWPPLPFFITCATRRAIRNKYGIKPSPCDDPVVHVLCPYCAMCQEGREVELASLGRVGTRSRTTS